MKSADFKKNNSSSKGENKLNTNWRRSGSNKREGKKS